MNRDGSDPERIVSREIVTDPNLSPDGRFFAYTKEVDGKWGVYVYEIEEATERLVVGQTNGE